MPNYLKMPKKHKFSPSRARLELPPHRSGDRRAPRNGQRGTTGRARQMRPKRSPALIRRRRPIPPRCRRVDGANAAKTFAGSEPNPAKTFPGSAPRRAVRRGASIARDHREARRRADPAADLAGPRRGVRLRRELRVGETVRADGRADAAGRRRLSLCPRGRRRKSIFFAARRRSTPPRASGDGPGCFA